MTLDAQRVSLCGARKGDTLVGVHSVTMGAIMRITEGSVHPSSREIDDHVRTVDPIPPFLSRLASLSFFENMTLKERETWILENQKDGDFDIAEEGVHVIVVEVGTSKLAVLGDKLQEVLDLNQPAMKIRNLMPRKPGSNARRHSLFFLTKFWRVVEVAPVTLGWTGLTMDCGNMTLMEGKPVDVTLVDGLAKSYLEGGKKVEKTQSLGLIFPKDEKDADIRSAAVAFATKDCCTIMQYFANSGIFTPAGYKSLLQKIIRYAPLSVVIEGKPYPALDALVATFATLATHAGSFVPDIQRFVTGRESAFKRLLVSILEDSHLKNDRDLARLATFAFLSQTRREWRPSSSDIYIAFRCCEESLATHSRFEWSSAPSNPFVLNVKSTHLQMVSCLLDHVRSFQSDLYLARSIALKKGLPCSQIGSSRPEFMDISHCVDQHWTPEIASFLPTPFLLQTKASKSSTPFAGVFGEIWRASSSLSFRRSNADPEDDELRGMIQVAQQLVMISRNKSCPLDFQPTGSVHTVKGRLSDSWIAGLVGPIIIGNAMVTLRPDDIYQMVAAKKPSRGLKDARLTDEQQDDAIFSAKQILRSYGITLPNSAPIGSLKGAMLRLVEVDGVDTYTIKGLGIDDALSYSLSIPILEKKKISLDLCLRRLPHGIQEDAFERFERLCINNPWPLRRLLCYLSTNRQRVTVARISRNGGGIDQAVILEDSGAVRFLLCISFLMPAVMQRVEGSITSFDILCRPLMDKIVKIIRDCLATPSPFRLKNGWNPIHDKSGRIPKSYQLDCLAEMIAKPKRGHFLWLTAGLGKTLTVLMFLQHLIEKKILPRYVVYSLPKSALTSVIAEMDQFEGLLINILRPVTTKGEHDIRSISRKEVLSWHVSIVEHDHLRLLEEELVSKASETFFILDEAHQALNESKRTDMALQISRLSVDFVAMTGTPMVDSNTYKLAWWLEQIVDFAVDEKNFWVAAAALTTKLANTGVDVKRKDIEMEMEDKKYLSLVPLSLGGTNARPSNSDIRKAFDMCYDACDKMMVMTTLRFIGVKKRKVMLVARNSEHQNILLSLLISKGVREDRIFVFTRDESIYLTDATVASGGRDYDIAVVPMSRHLGYTLTRMSVMVTGVYFSNQASRDQMEGRINRVGQRSKKVTYVTVHCGILTSVLRRYREAGAIMRSLESYASILEKENS